MYYPRSFIYFLFVMKNLSIPPDISKHIYNFIRHSSAQCIINNWYSHIMLHNINPCYIIQKLKLFTEYDPHNYIFVYCDLLDSSVGTIFNICTKYLDCRTTCFSFWLSYLQYVYNGVLVVTSTDNPVYILNLNSIHSFETKLLNYFI